MFLIMIDGLCFFLESCCFLPIILFHHFPSSEWHFTFCKKKKKKEKRKNSDSICIE